MLGCCVPGIVGIINIIINSPDVIHDIVYWYIVLYIQVLVTWGLNIKIYSILCIKCASILFIVHYLNVIFELLTEEDDGILLVSTDNGLSTDWGWPLHWPSVAIPWQSPAIPVAIVAMGGQRIDTMGRVEGTGPLPLLLAGTAGHELFQNCKNLCKMWNC